MSDNLARVAFKALRSDDQQWKQLYVTCEANRLLAIYFWFLVEENSACGPAVDVYSRALRSVANAEEPIRTVDTLLAMEGIGPNVSKVPLKRAFGYSNRWVQIVTDYLWKRYPPDSDGLEGDDGGEFEKPQPIKPIKKHGKTFAQGYRPVAGSSNYAFLITLLQAHERGEKFVTKTELMSRAEASGLCSNCVYGGDPLYHRKNRFPRVGRPVELLGFTGWKCLQTLKKQKPSWVEIFGRPRKVMLTPCGVTIARFLKEEAIETGRLEEPVQREDLLEKNPAAGSKTDATAAQAVAVDDPEVVVLPALTWLPKNVQTVRPKAEAPPLKIAIRKIHPVLLPYTNPQAAFDDEFELILAIDQREQFSRAHPNAPAKGRKEALAAHMEVLKKAGVTVSTRQLNLGDALWIARKKEGFSDGGEEYLLDWIVERKRVDDLAASIIDKRYEQQKYWLCQCGVSNIVYLVEGDPDALERATVSTELADGYRVVRTKSHQETLEFYTQLTQALKRKYNRASSMYAIQLASFGTKALFSESTKEAATFQEFQDKLAGLKRMTNQQIWGLMITRIAGIGPESAGAVAERYPTPKAFIHAKEHNDDFLEVLPQIRTSETNRRLGPKKTRRLIRGLFPYEDAE